LCSYFHSMDLDGAEHKARFLWPRDGTKMSNYVFRSGNCKTGGPIVPHSIYVWSAIVSRFAAVETRTPAELRRFRAKS